MTSRPTRHGRLKAKGMVFIMGWLPEEIALPVQRRIEAYRDKVERIAETPPKRGRPPKVRTPTG